VVGAMEEGTLVAEGMAATWGGGEACWVCLEAQLAG
jgi:hypothetical protein